MRAMSVLESAKSNCHRKTHRVEPGGAGRMFMHLTRGDPRPERVGEVSRGRSSVDLSGNGRGVKGRRTKRGRSAHIPRWAGREGIRNGEGAATAAATHPGGRRKAGWNPRRPKGASSQSPCGRKEAEEDAQ